MREFEERAQELISLTLSKYEIEVAECSKPPPPQKRALCAAAVSLQEALKPFVSLAK
jgi:hypothetical protein